GCLKLRSMLNVYHRGKLQGEHQVAKSNTHPTEWQLWSARARQRFPGVLPGLHYHLYERARRITY
ncbi:MAG TPA: hypothetical protein VFD63_19910, partial [Pyrinomonadaceae bacterium]|nr:hypothetical protein [Pyrinomonadaceae bacterium]